MKKLSLSLCLILLGIIVNAQNPNLNYKYGFKLNNLTTVEDNDQIQNMHFLKPTVSALFQTKKWNTHEIELIDFFFDRATTSNSPDLYNYTGIKMRYQYFFNFNKKKNSKWIPSLGIGAAPYITSYSYSSPNLSSTVVNKELDFGVDFYVTPKLTYMFSKRFFADLSIPIMMSNINTEKHSTNDPSISSSYQSPTITNFNMFPAKYQINLGIGVRF